MVLHIQQAPSSLEMGGRVVDDAASQARRVQELLRSLEKEPSRGLKKVLRSLDEGQKVVLHIQHTSQKVPHSLELRDDDNRWERVKCGDAPYPGGNP